MAKRKTSPKKKGAVATKDSTTEVAAINIDSFLEANAGDGSQNIGTNDLELPRLKLFHGSAKDAPDDISKADIYHNISKHVWKKSEGVRVIPCTFIKQYTHWRNIEQEGGFLGVYDSSSDILTKTKKVEAKDVLLDENGQLTEEYIRTDGNFFVLVEEEEGIWKPAQISMYSTNFKKAKLWNTMIKSQVMQGKNGVFTPPSYAYIYRLTGKVEKKEAMSWASWEIALEDSVKEVELLSEAKAFANSVSQGDIAVKPEVEVAETTSDNEDSGMI
jgi:hypothetical protein